MELDEREKLENEVDEAEAGIPAGEEAATEEDAAGTQPEGEETAGAVEDAAEDAGSDAGEDAAEEKDGEARESGAGTKPKGLFGRRDKKELAKKDAEIAEIRDRYMRTLAEYENYRKRTEKEKADIYTYAVKDVMNKILPVLDNLERGIAAVPEESKDDPFAQGMDRILRQFEKALDDIGVKPIEAAGQPFDPVYHNAVMHVEDENLGAGVVAEDLQKGYTYKDAVVRHSMVKVAN